MVLEGLDFSSVDMEQQEGGSKRKRAGSASSSKSKPKPKPAKKPASASKPKSKPKPKNVIVTMITAFTARVKALVPKRKKPVSGKKKH